MSLLVATQITAIATAVLGAGAIVTAVFAFLAFRKQSAEVAVIQQQTADQAGVLALQALDLQASLDERKREAQDRRQVQAALVFVTQAGQPDVLRAGDQPVPRPRVIAAHVENTSDQPIYDVEAAWHLGSEPWGDPNPEPLPTVLPHTAVDATREFPVGTNLGVSGAVIRFRDASGIRWQRRPDGELTEFPG